jgi:hypothetical protein
MMVYVSNKTGGFVKSPAAALPDNLVVAAQL